MKYSTNQVIDALTAAYIKDGKWRSIAEIAVLAGVSEAVTRKRITENFHSAACLLVSEQDTRESRDRSFGMQVGYHKVMTYAPTRAFLLSILRINMHNNEA